MEGVGGKGNRDGLDDSHVSEEKLGTKMKG